MRLELKDVTICAVDSVNAELAARALNLSVAQCEFSDAILFSHAPVEGAFRAVKIDKIESRAAYSNFVFKRLPSLIESPFLLIVQWDGYRCRHPISSLPALGAATKENELSSSNLLLTILPLKNTVRRGQTPHLGIW